MSTEATVSAALLSAFQAIAVSDLGMSGTGQIYDYLFEDHDLQNPQSYLLDGGTAGSPINAVGFEVLFEDDPYYVTDSAEENGANRTYIITIEAYRNRSAGIDTVMAACRKLIGAVRGIDWTALHCDEFTPMRPTKRFQTVDGVVGFNGMIVGVFDFTCNELHPTY